MRRSFSSSAHWLAACFLALLCAACASTPALTQSTAPDRDTPGAGLPSQDVAEDGVQILSETPGAGLPSQDVAEDVVQIPSETFMAAIQEQSQLSLFTIWPSTSIHTPPDLTPVPFDPSQIKDTPLLKGVPIADIARIQAEVKRHYWEHWPRVAARSSYYRGRVLEVIKEMGAPEALQVLPIVESGYNPYAFSWAGAAGLWQLMPATARTLGIKHSHGFDGRRDVSDSTRGGIQYLMDMYAEFGNWPLALAAYHRGPNSVARSLRKRPWKPEDGLDRLPVPAITRHYVRHVLGFASLYHIGVLEFPEAIETAMIEVDVPVDVAVLAEASGLEKDTLFELNPGLDYSQYSKGLRLHVPVTYADALKSQLADAEPKLVRVAVRSGDSLWKIARRHHTTVDGLRRLNPSAGDVLRPGDELLVPSSKYVTRLAAASNPLLTRSNRIRYTVRRGDSLWRIAQRFGTTTRAIARANQIDEDKLIRPGEKLWVLARSRPS